MEKILSIDEKYMIKGEIYLILNTITKKSYIGQTKSQIK